MYVNGYRYLQYYSLNEFVFKQRSNLLPDVFNGYCSEIREGHTYNTRNNRNLQQPFVRTSRGQKKQQNTMVSKCTTTYIALWKNLQVLDSSKIEQKAGTSAITNCHVYATPS